MNLAELQYPRHFHKYGGLSVIVPDLATAEQIVKDGWKLLPPKEPDIAAGPTLVKRKEAK